MSSSSSSLPYSSPPPQQLQQQPVLSVPPRPPVLHFDDGSRAMAVAATTTRTKATTRTPTTATRTKETPPQSSTTTMEGRYEISRVLDEIRGELAARQGRRQQQRREQQRRQDSSNSEAELPRPYVGVALQFPESLLSDAPLVCRELERRWNDSSSKSSVNRSGEEEEVKQHTEQEQEQPPQRLFAFCVGDSDDDDCCPDVDGAAHVPGTLFLVQFGHHSCLSYRTTRSVGNTSSVGNPEQCCGQGGGGDSCGSSSSSLPTNREQGAECCRGGHDEKKKEETSGSSNDDDDDDDSGLCVLRAFGRRPVGAARFVERIRQALIKDEREFPNRPRRRRFILLYDLRYLHAVQDLAAALSEGIDALVVVGKVPAAGRRSDVVVAGGLELPASLVDWPSYCLLYVGGGDGGGASTSINWQFLHISLRLQGSGISHVLTYDPALETAADATKSEAESNGTASSSDSNPIINPVVATDWSPLTSRFLKRRFFLVQKARAARTVGIVVAANVGGRGGGEEEEKQGDEDSPSQGKAARRVVQALIRILTERDRAPYMYSVGRNVTVAKLSNFADLVDCFVYVACPYGTLRTLHGLDRQVAVPVLTPLEMATALDLVEWNTCRPSRGTSEAAGGSADTGYSVDWDDFLAVARGTASPSSAAGSTVRNDSRASGQEQDGEDNDDDDAPFFSLVTGKYESHAPRAPRPCPADPQDLALLPGQGVLTRHVSTAADALRRREFQGLRPEVGATAIRAATPGQRGIASDYGDR